MSAFAYVASSFGKTKSAVVLFFPPQLGAVPGPERFATCDSRFVFAYVVLSQPLVPTYDLVLACGPPHLFSYAVVLCFFGRIRWFVERPLVSPLTPLRPPRALARGHGVFRFCSYAIAYPVPFFCFSPLEIGRSRSWEYLLEKNMLRFSTSALFPLLLGSPLTFCLTSTSRPFLLSLLSCRFPFRVVAYGTIFPRFSYAFFLMQLFLGPALAQPKASLPPFLCFVRC